MVKIKNLCRGSWARNWSGTYNDNVRRICITQCDPTYDNGFLDGPNGGLEGSVETVLFRIDKAADVNIGDVFTSRNHVRLICYVSCVYVYLE